MIHISINTNQPSTHNGYIRLLLDFADSTGTLDQLYTYIDDLTSTNADDFMGVDFQAIKFELN